MKFKIDERKYPPEDYAGILLFRPHTSGRSAAQALVRRYLPDLLRADLSGHLLVITEKGIRIR